MLSDHEFRQLLDDLDRPWAGFRKVRKGVKKRVRRHMEQLGCFRIEDYIEHIHRNPYARNECDRCLMVTISRFFRDRRLWDHLQHHVLPALIDRYQDGLAAWSAGCANGEEPYSLAMIYKEAAASSRFAAHLHILATDADDAGLLRAAAGLYPASSLSEIPEHLKTRYFFKVRGGRQWRIDPGLREDITWQVHHLLEAPPLGPFHLIFLRNNLLTYYQGAVIEDALAHIAVSLVPDGVLILGSHERLPANDLAFIRSPACPWVYYRNKRR